MSLIRHRKKLTRLCESQNHRCCYCGVHFDYDRSKRNATPNQPSIDHVIPLSEGGARTWENEVAACRQCNSYRRSMDAYRFYYLVTSGRLLVRIHADGLNAKQRRNRTHKRRAQRKRRAKEQQQFIRTIEEANDPAWGSKLRSVREELRIKYAGKPSGLRHDITALLDDPPLAPAPLPKSDQE